MAMSAIVNFMHCIVLCSMLFDITIIIVFANGNQISMFLTWTIKQNLNLNIIYMYIYTLYVQILECNVDFLINGKNMNSFLNYLKCFFGIFLILASMQLYDDIGRQNSRFQYNMTYSQIFPFFLITHF